MFQIPMKVIITLIIVNIFILTVDSVDTRNVTFIPNQETIKSIVIVTRHGDRNIIATYPTDPNEEYFRLSGFGAMRPDGCLRLYHKGRILSTKLLPVVNNRTQTYLRAASNPYPLVIESLGCFMAGINGPQLTINAKNDPEIDVPFGPKDNDTELNFGRLPCPVRNEATKNSSDLANMRLKYSKMLDKLQTGINSQGANVRLNFSAIIPIIINYTEPIVDEDAMGLPRAPWVDDEFVADAKRAGAEEFEILGKFPIQRNLSSFFVRELIHRLKNTSGDGLSFSAFSSVSTSMVPMMITVGLWEGERPTYAEALIFILRKSGQFEQFFYGVNSTLKQFTPEGCSNMDACTLDQFEDSMKKFYIDDWKKACGIPESGY